MLAQVSQNLGVYNASYRPDIDGMRAIAVIGVLLFHAFPSLLPGGFVGVDVFFVISGYLISSHIFRDLGSGNFSLLTFFRRRIRRIFPALLVVMAACLLAGWFLLLRDEYEQLGKHVAAGAGFVANIVLWLESGYFDKAGIFKPLQHLWSLGVEEQFYILWPVVALLVWPRKYGLVLALAGISATSFILNVILISREPSFSFYSPLTRLWELLAGAGLAWVEFNGRRLPARGVLAYVGLVALVLSFVLTPEIGFPGWWVVLPDTRNSLCYRGGASHVCRKGFVSEGIRSDRRDQLPPLPLALAAPVFSCDHPSGGTAA